VLLGELKFHPGMTLCLVKRMRTKQVRAGSQPQYL
jgi:hypothetical protein